MRHMGITIKILCIGTDRSDQTVQTDQDLHYLPFYFWINKVKVKVSHSLIAVGAVGVRVPLYLGHSPSLSFRRLKIPHCKTKLSHFRIIMVL